MRSRRAWLIPLVSVLVAGGGIGCTDVSRSGSDGPGVRLPAPQQQTGERRSITRSSSKDIAAVLRANGVEDPERWADVVIANQPYPAEDPGLAKLRTALTDQRADPATADRIVGLLAP